MNCQSLACLFLIAFLCGCATATAPRLHSEIWTTNKVGEVTHEIRESKGSAFLTWGDSVQFMEKLRVSNGKTHSIGVSGYESESTTTNVPAILNAGGELIGRAVKAFIVP